MIGRREFVNCLGSIMMPWTVAAQAQQAGSVRRISLLFNRFENDATQQAMLQALRAGLVTLGWLEGRNLRVDLRWGARERDRLQSHARDLIALGPDVIVTDAGEATRVVQSLTKTIPIVYLTGGDPVVTGLVRDIARPEGNTTGFSNFENTLGSKWLGLLKEAKPALASVGLIFNPENLSSQTNANLTASVNAAAAALSLRTVELPVRDPIEVVRTIDAFAATPNSGMIVFPQTAVGALTDTIIRMAKEHRLLAIYSNAELVAAGGLMSYGSDPIDQARRAAAYVDRLLRGSKIIELPVQFATRLELKINLKTANAIGLELPQFMLLRAEEVIQ
jgi:putative ABC transport system substrate-binding protein